jgi:PncC family amidohydrolase
MAKGACKASGADISISVTGLAGPGGGTKETPVGTVFMGCCYKGKAIAKEFHFTGNRMRIREQTTAHALAMLRDCIIMGK